MTQDIRLRLSVKWFAEQMELKLRENDHKGGWNDMHQDWLLSRLREEMMELDQEMHKLDASPIAIVREAVHEK